jgi:hypothetical protein
MNSFTEKQAGPSRLFAHPGKLGFEHEQTIMNINSSASNGENKALIAHQIPSSMCQVL